MFKMTYVHIHQSNIDFFLKLFTENYILVGEGLR